MWIILFSEVTLFEHMCLNNLFILDCRYSSVITVENIRVSNCIPFQLSQEKQNKIPYANTDQNTINNGDLQTSTSPNFFVGGNICTQAM